jgi:hypothetical protein
LADDFMLHVPLPKHSRGVSDFPCRNFSHSNFQALKPPKCNALN